MTEGDEKKTYSYIKFHRWLSTKWSAEEEGVPTLRAIKEFIDEDEKYEDIWS